MKFAMIVKNGKETKMHHRKITCVYSDAIGLVIFPNVNSDIKYVVRDQCKVNNRIYLLVSNMLEKDRNIAIYKVFDVNEFVLIHASELLFMKKKFESVKIWKRLTALEITSEGAIKIKES